MKNKKEEKLYTASILIADIIAVSIEEARSFAEEMIMQGDYTLKIKKLKTTLYVEKEGKK